MNIEIRQFTKNDLPEMVEIWNEIVEEGIAFPQEDKLNLKTADKFFSSQTYTGVAEDEGKILGLYILHPNNIGRCGHIANASYGVSSNSRGKHIGEKLVIDCINQAKLASFRILQFNAVVVSNIHARHLYERLGFKQVGVIPNGFRLKNDEYEDICIYYIDLVDG